MRRYLLATDRSSKSFYTLGNASILRLCLTVSEVFPLEVRALAIALFYAIGTGAASLSPVIFGILIQSGKPINVFFGFVVDALLMAGAGVVAIFFAVDTERKSLESVARPLSFVEDREEAT